MFADVLWAPLGLAVAGGGSIGVGLYFTRWLVEWISGRVDKRQADLDAGRDALDQGWKAYRLVLEDKIAAQGTRITELENEVAECTRKHAEAEARLIRVEAFMDGRGKASAIAQGMLSAERVKGDGL